MNRITFARVIATHSNVVCRFYPQIALITQILRLSNLWIKKRTLLIATSVIRGLPLELRSLSSQESDLTTEIDNRHRRAAVADVANDLSSVLRLEVLVPEVVQRNLTRGRRRL